MRAETILQALDERASAAYLAPFWRGTILFGLERLDEAYAELERAFPTKARRRRFSARLGASRREARPDSPTWQSASAFRRRLRSLESGRTSSR